MATYRRQLKDENGDNIIPAMPQVTTADIQDGAITADKLGFNFIEKVGTADNYCLKFFDGTMIACINYQFNNLDAATQWGSVYGADLSAQTYAEQFYSIPVEVAGFVSNRSGDSGNGWVYKAGGRNSTTKTATYGIIRGTRSTVTGAINIIAIGRWKA